jgi:drug/metabolite transporter (DMT)-like permease
MLALSLGLSAALFWAIHDLLARKLTQGATLLPIMAMVLGTGTVVLAPVALAYGDWGAMGLGAVLVAMLSGLAITLAIGGLYRAFSLAPVRLVSPVIGAYPLFSLALAVGQGRVVSSADWLAVGAMVLGIAVVAIASRGDGPEDYAAPPRVALFWAFLSSLGFAATFALAQEATRMGSELPVALIGRLVALAATLALIFRHRGKVLGPGGQNGILSVMGAIDAIALTLVTASGALPKAEYASASSSLFGVLTVLLAAWFLKEGVRAVQWVGIALVFGGIAILGLQGS